MLFWLWCIFFFTGNMNLVVLLTTILLGNRTTDIDFEAQQQNLETPQLLQPKRQLTSEELRYKEKWLRYKDYYGKYYDIDEEDYKRMKIFIENSKLIDGHNQLYKTGLSTYELGHNAFSDLTHEEFLEQYTTFKKSSLNPSSEINDGSTLGEPPTVRNEPTVRQNPTVRYDSTVQQQPTVRYDPTSSNDPTVHFNFKPTVRYEDYEYEWLDHNRQESKKEDYVEYMPPANVQIPTTIDWRRIGAVTAVKTQGKCKASWLFSATGTIEGQIFRKTGNLTSLSEQNILDCSKKYGNDGCKNGSVLNSLQYIQKNQGLDPTKVYPWHGRKAWFCYYKNYKSNPQIRDVVKVQSGNETALQAAVATVGPISVGVDASSKEFKFYKRGIYFDTNCTSHNLNYDMLVVGYARPYWIVKNSVGEEWGREGYILMAKNKTNQCGIATRALYPLV